jgi:hypothetical protein
LFVCLFVCLFEKDGLQIQKDGSSL